MGYLYPDSNDRIVWKLDESASPFLNTGSLGTANLTGTGSYSPGQAGKWGNCVRFPNSASYLSSAAGVGDSIFSGAVTLSCWVYLVGWGGTWASIFYKTYYPSSWLTSFASIGFQMANTFDGSWVAKMTFPTNQDRGVLLSAPAHRLTLGAWHHIGITVDGTNRKVFLNGQVIFSTPETQYIDVSQGGLWRMGYEPLCGGQDFDGYIDDARVANVARPESWFKDIYTGTQQREAITIKSGIPTIIGTDTPRANLDAHAGLTINAPVTYATGVGPSATCFDGVNIWVANRTDHTVTKKNATTGALVGTYAAGGDPIDVIVVGSTIWVANNDARTVTVLSQATGAILNTYNAGPSGSFTYRLCYDGTNVWAANNTTGHVSKIRASDGFLVGSYSVGNASPFEPIFDGTNIWVSVYWGPYVRKFLASTGAFIGDYPIPTRVRGLCFDGTYIWVTSEQTRTLRKLLASTGAFVADYTMPGTLLADVKFDGTNIWVVGETDASHSYAAKLALDGTILGSYPIAWGSYSVDLGGSYMWAVGGDDNAVTRLPFAPVVSGDACQVSGALALGKAVNTSTSPLIGIYDGVRDSVVKEGVVAATFKSGLSLSAGGPVYLSDEAGKLTNVKPYFSNVHEVGVVVDASTSKVLLQPKPVISLPGYNIWAPGSAAIWVSKLTPMGAKIADYPLARGAWACCYDGIDGIWITSCVASPDNYIYKVNKNTGVVEQSIQTPYGSIGTPTGICSDGAYVYVAIHHGSTYGALRQWSLSGVAGWTTAVGDNPYLCCYDSLNQCVWVPSYVSNRVDKVRCSDGTNLGNYPCPSGAFGACFDRSSATVWVTGRGANQVRKFSAVDGSTLGTYNVGSDPIHCASDGTYVYVSNRTTGSVSKVRISDGAVTPYTTAADQYMVYCDGDGYLWVARTSGTVLKMRMSDGVVLGSFATGATCLSVCSDKARV